jgi:hypothetical protein
MHELLFSSLEEIYAMHREFLTELSVVMKKYNHYKTCLSSVIDNRLFGREGFKKLYSGYCANYPKSNKMAKILFKNNTGFRALLKQSQIESINTFDSYLIKPMQRLCKYELLLRNYIKNMEPEDLDFQDLKRTVAQVEKLVKGTNEQVEEFLLEEKFNNDIRGQFEGILVQLPNPNRKLLFTVEDIDLVSEDNSRYR